MDSSSAHCACAQSAAACSSGVASGAAVRSASSAPRQSGTITKLTNGTATRFDSAPTSDASPKNQTVSGSSASDITSWPSVSSRTKPSTPRPRARHSIRNATPTNDSQKPGDSTASGSTIEDRDERERKRLRAAAGATAARASATTAIISSVRTVGRLPPASTP